MLDTDNCKGNRKYKEEKAEKLRNWKDNGFIVNLLERCLKCAIRRKCGKWYSAVT